MFERYTEKARRVIFYARYEASEFGSPGIDTEHLLLGLLREDAAVLAGYLRTPFDAEALRARLQPRPFDGQPIPTSIDLPLTSAAKRVLATAAEEADRLGHRHVGNEHLFLGLLREEHSLASQILREHGVSAEEARLKMHAAGPWQGSPIRGAGTGGGTGAAAVDPSQRVAVPMPQPLTLRLIGEDASLVAHVCWPGRIGRYPQIGECLEIEGHTSRYRILDLRWHIAHNGANLTQQGEVVLTVRAEDSAGPAG